MSIAPSTPNKSDRNAQACPLCASPECELAGMQNVQDVIRQWRKLHAIDAAEYFMGMESFKEYLCRNCGLRFFFPSVMAGKPALYEQLSGADYYRAEKWEYHAALADLNGAKKLLEVGCGAGEFLSLARQQTGLEGEGLEANDAAVYAALNRGLHVRRNDFQNVAQQFPGYYDAVCFFQVLEHVPSPGTFLRAACTALRSGGKLILAVPDAESFLRHAWSILDMPPHHMTRWTSRVLEQLPAMFPLDIFHIRGEPLADYHVADYAEAWLSYWSRRALLSGLAHPKAKRLAAGVIRFTGLRHFLSGHSLYACYIRR